MKPIIGRFFLLSALLSTAAAAALKCYHCHEKNSDKCKQEEKECPEGESCITISEEYKLNGTYHSIYKGCSRNIPCDRIPYGKVNNDVYLLYSTNCCDTDLCNDKFFEMPEDDEPSGIVCESCFVPNSVEDCTSDTKIMCRGKDDKCLTFAGEVEKPDGVVLNYTAKGCMSTLGCQLELSQLVGIDVLNEISFKCTDNPPQPPREEDKNRKKIELVP